MTIAELIKELQILPQNALVLVPGYEGDYVAISTFTPKCVRHVKDQSWYYGDFIEEEPDDMQSEVQWFNAIALDGTHTKD